MEKYVVCEKCGALVKVLIDCTCENCGIKCCGNTMKEISAEEVKECYALYRLVQQNSKKNTKTP